MILGETPGRKPEEDQYPTIHGEFNQPIELPQILVPNYEIVSSPSDVRRTIARFNLLIEGYVQKGFSRSESFQGVVDIGHLTGLALDPFSLAEQIDSRTTTSIYAPLGSPDFQTVIKQGSHNELQIEITDPPIGISAGVSNIREVGDLYLICEGQVIQGSIARRNVHNLDRNYSDKSWIEPESGVASLLVLPGKTDIHHSIKLFVGDRKPEDFEF